MGFVHEASPCTVPSQLNLLPVSDFNPLRFVLPTLFNSNGLLRYAPLVQIINQIISGSNLGTLDSALLSHCMTNVCEWARPTR